MTIRTARQRAVLLVAGPQGPLKELADVMRRTLLHRRQDQQSGLARWQFRDGGH